MASLGAGQCPHVSAGAAGPTQAASVGPKVPFGLCPSSFQRHAGREPDPNTTGF